MQDKSFDTVIISDLHMGSDLSRAGDALDFLRSVQFRRLILLGDMFADLNFSRLTKEHWKFLGYIRKLSNPRHDIEVVWVEGNHDHGLTEVMSHLVGIPVYQQYEWTYAGKKHLAIHGHQFDSFAIKNFRITHFGQLVFLWLQKIDSKNKRFARYLDRLNTRWLRLSAQVAQGALSHGKQADAERIFCGHTHAPLSTERDGVEYYNSGAWVDLRCTYITVDQEGVSIFAGITIVNFLSVNTSQNESRLLPTLLESLCRQDYSLLSSTKVFVADAGSTDGTPELAMSFADRLNIEVIPGGLPSAGRNAGARIAETAYVLFIDADMELKDPTLLRRAMELTEKRKLHCVTTNIWCSNGTLRDNLLYIGNNIVQYGSALVMPFSTGMFMLFDRATFEKLGGFNEGALYAEDYLLSKKVANHRFGIVRGRIHTTNRRFRNMGYFKILGLFLKTALNTFNDGYFLHDQGYWRQKV